MQRESIAGRIITGEEGEATKTCYSYLCRLAAPLAYNFLSIAHLQDTNFIDVSSFYSSHLVSFLSTPNEVFIDLMQVMGAMETKELGKKFMIGFPVLVVVLCLATMFNVYSKIGAICCIKSLRYPFSPPLFLFYLFISTLKKKRKKLRKPPSYYMFDFRGISPR